MLSLDLACQPVMTHTIRPSKAFPKDWPQHYVVRADDYRSSHTSPEDEPVGSLSHFNLIFAVAWPARCHSYPVRLPLR
jgi:hypothetical protein